LSTKMIILSTAPCQTTPSTLPRLQIPRQRTCTNEHDALHGDYRVPPRKRAKIILRALPSIASSTSANDRGRPTIAFNDVVVACVAHSTKRQRLTLQHAMNRTTLQRQQNCDR
jgi:hypothetical protein